MNDLEKLELSIRRVIDRINELPITATAAEALLMLVDQMRDDEAGRRNEKCPIYPGCQPDNCTKCFEHS